MKNSEKSKRNGTISAFIERPYHAGTRLVVALVLTLTVASLVAAQGPILPIYLPIILKTFSGGQVSDASGSGAAPEQVDLSADTGSGDNSGVPAAQQDDADCDDPDADHGKKMKCKQKKLAETMCETSDIAAKDTDGAIFTDRQKERFKEECDRTTAWVNAPGREEEFRKQLRKSTAECYVEEIDNDGIGDDDGVCTKGEQNKGGCAVADEEDKDGDGKCSKVKEGKGKTTWEKCLLTCDVQVEGVDVQVEGVIGVSAAEDDLIDTTRAELVENAVDETTETLTDLNGLLEEMQQELKEARVAQIEPTLPYNPTQCMGLLLFKAKPKFAGDHDDKKYNYDYPPNGGADPRPKSYEMINDWRLAANYAQGATDLACGVTLDVGMPFLGNSGISLPSGICVMVVIADSIVRDVATGLEMLDDTITATRIDNAVQCLETVKKDLDEANDKLDKMLKVDLQVTELKEKSEFLVGATVGGNPARDVEFISVKVADSSISFLDVTGYMNYTEVDPGMYRVLIDLPQEAKDAQIFAFQVSARTKVGDEDFELFGFTHFHRGTQ